VNGLEQVGKCHFHRRRRHAGSAVPWLKRLTARVRRRRAKRELQAGREPAPEKKFRGWFW